VAGRRPRRTFHRQPGLAGTGQTAIRYNVPHLEPYESAETVKLQEAMARPDGFLAELESKLGSFYQDSSENGSRLRAKFALEILKRYKPQFMTVHFVSLDHGGHVKGPFSPEANAALEAEDALVGELRAQALANDPDAIVAVVSDHGMAPVTQNLNLRGPLVERALQKPVRRRGNQVFLAGEMVLQRALRDARALHDPVDGGFGIAVFGQAIDGGAADRFARPGAFGFLPVEGALF